jgi:type I restriction enzyme S subunit
MARAMKDSGIEWIGEIPEEWEVNKLKYLGELDANGVDKKIIEGESTYKSVHYMDVYRNSLREIKNSNEYLVVSSNDNKAKSCSLKQGDVLFTNSSETPGDMGHSTVIGEDLENTLFGYHLMRFRSILEIYLYYKKYLFGSSYLRTWFEYRSTGITRYGISFSDFAEALIPLPPVHEQQAIADHLDEKCGLIDSIIEKQKTVIEKLKLYRQSVITEAVTKGLDVNAKMKPSGIEWIGDIPEGWGICRIKQVSSKIGSGKTPTGGSEVYLDEGVLFIRSQNVYNDGLYLDDAVYISDAIDKEMSSTRVMEGDVLLNITGGSIGRSCVCPPGIERANVNQHVCIIRTTGILSKYLHFVVVSYVGQEAIKVYQSGANREGLNFEQIANMVFARPSKEEQQAIADYLDTKCEEIDSAINTKQKLIDKLAEYKKSLIYECVTGKREVV